MINCLKGQIKFLKHRRVVPRGRLTALFNNKYGTNYTVEQIRTLCYRKGFKTGRDGRFVLGHRAWNCGTRGTGLCKPNSGSFKKGRQSTNHRPVGSERIDTDGYIYVKTAEPNIWRMKHILVWEEKNGPVPKGKILRFRNGNSLNCLIDNLQLMDRNFHCRLNKLHYKSAPEKLKKSVYIIAQLQMMHGKVRRAA